MGMFNCARNIGCTNFDAAGPSIRLEGMFGVAFRTRQRGNGLGPPPGGGLSLAMGPKAQ
jgi:hypothetical protein